MDFYRRKMEDQRGTAAEKELSIAWAGPVAIPEVSVLGTARRAGAQPPAPRRARRCTVSCSEWVSNILSIAV
jgi:hypothetical protein